MKIGDRARNKWRSILPQLGVETKFLTGKHGPCPHCGGKDRYRFDDREGSGSFFCSQCGSGDGFRLLELVKGWPFAEAAREVEAIVGTATEAPPKRKMSPDKALSLSRGLWKASKPIQPGDEVARYLAGRKLIAPDGADLRFCPSCDITNVPGVTALPAMIALVRAPTGEGVTLHRTYLSAGRKADIDSARRIMPGEMVKGVAIRLMSHDGVLGVAEGIETAIAASLIFRVPCWAALDEGKLRDFEMPDDITELRIFGDNDRNLVGQAAAYQLGARVARRKSPPKVAVHIPDIEGDDWADVWAAQHAEK